MNGIKRQFLLHALKIFDIALVVVSFAFAASLHVHPDYSVSMQNIFTMKLNFSDSVIFAIAMLLCHRMFAICDLYESKRLSTRSAETVDVLKATSLSTACLALVAVVFHVRLITPYFLAVFWLTSSLGASSFRCLLRHWLASLRKAGHNLHHILILGTNSRAIAFAQKIQEIPEKGYRLLGFVDDEWEKIDEFLASGFTLACDSAGLPEFLRHNIVDEVAIYLPLRSFYERAASMASICEQHGVILRFDPEIFNLKTSRPHAIDLDGDPRITAHVDVFEVRAFFFKRAIDLIVSSVLLIALSPLLLLVAALIKFTSPGPVFFGQKRVGLNKRQFVMYKFRTMIPNAERLQEELVHLNEMSGPVFKIKNDPRVTPLGRFLRRTSIDELPQLFNVLKGEMSLVGPRAMSVRDYQLFSEDWQRRRFSVPPGITCLWQICGRNSIPFEQWMELDMQYIDKWSLWLDLKILLRTVPAVLKGLGAA